MKMSELREGATGNKKKALNYILDLASQVDQDITDWDITEIFSVDGEITNSHGEINKRFFQKMRELDRKPDLSLSPDERLKIAKFVEYINYASSQNIAREIRSKENSISDYNQTITTYIKDISVLMERKNSFDRLGSEIEQIVKDGWFKLSNMGESFINFLTPPINITYIRPQDQKEFRLPIGTLRVELRPADRRLTVWRHQNNLMSSRNYHMFVGTDSSVCWGNAQNHYAKIMAEGKYAEVFRLLASLLTTYPGGTPHASVEQLWEQNFASTPECGICGEDHRTPDHDFECDDCGGEYRDGDGHECPALEEDNFEEPILQSISPLTLEQMGIIRDSMVYGSSPVNTSVEPSF